MPTIDYYASGFPGSAPALLLADGAIDASWHDIVWAAVSVGKSGMLDLFQHGTFSLAELMFRGYMVFANLYEANGHLTRSPAYDNLDPSEKGAVSYFFGMAFAKLAAERLLHVPWLVHLLKMQQVELAGRTRPDLVGITVAGEWVVIEAKGRSGQFSTAAMEIAKQQVQGVGTINGTAPQYSVASQAYFSSYLELAIVDPEPEDLAVDIRLTHNDLLEAYYAPFRRIAVGADQRVIDGKTYDFVRFEILDMSIGVDHRLLSNPQEAVSYLRAGKADDRPLIVRDSLTVYPDGLAIELGERWSREAMTKPPTERE